MMLHNPGCINLHNFFAGKKRGKLAWLLAPAGLPGCIKINTFIRKRAGSASARRRGWGKRIHFHFRGGADVAQNDA